MNQYRDEASSRWGSTPAYQQNEDKTAGYTPEKWIAVQSEMDRIMREFAHCKARDLAPESMEAQRLVRKWQTFLTDNYYDCTMEILSALGRMYSADPRFRENIDRYGAGTAAFMASAIAVYCGR